MKTTDDKLIILPLAHVHGVIMIDLIFYYTYLGDWSFPLMKGISLPHSSYCSFTAIDDHRALVFGGNVDGRRVDNLYLIDFNTMVSVFIS